MWALAGVTLTPWRKYGLGMESGLAALRVLVVDDNAQMRSIVGTVLAAAGIRQLHYATGGRQGLKAVAAFKPDVCYVDCEMSDVNGLDFISAVRALDTAARQLPIIMLTGHSDLTHLNAVRDRGVTEFLTKPVTARTILTRLQAVIDQPRPFIDTPAYVGPDRRRRRLAGGDAPKRRRTDSTDAFEL